MCRGCVKSIFGIYEGYKKSSKAEMRYSDQSLTANVSTDLKPLDVAGAVASLAHLPLDAIGGPSEAVTGR